MAKKNLDQDLIKVYGDRYDKWKGKVEQNKLIRALYWGDEVEMPTPAQASDDTAGYKLGSCTFCPHQPGDRNSPSRDW
jgi:hypothetical protein